MNPSAAIVIFASQYICVLRGRATRSHHAVNLNITIANSPQSHSRLLVAISEKKIRRSEKNGSSWNLGISAGKSKKKKQGKLEQKVEILLLFQKKKNN